MHCFTNRLTHPLLQAKIFSNQLGFGHGCVFSLVSFCIFVVACEQVKNAQQRVRSIKHELKNAITPSYFGYAAFKERVIWPSRWQSYDWLSSLHVPRVTCCPLSCAISSIFFLPAVILEKYPKLSAMTCRFSQPGHLMTTTPFS